MKTKVFLTIALATAITFNTAAQEKENRFSIELNGGASLAISQPGETNLNPGFGFEGLLHYRFLPHTGLYGGWGWNRFGADNSFAGTNVCFEETGYIFGLQFIHPVGTGPVSLYARAGGLYNHIEIENAEGEIVKDSKHGLGWQLAGGVDLDLGSNWSINPGVKFNALNREVEHEGVTVPLKQNYLSARIGILKKF